MEILTLLLMSLLLNSAMQLLGAPLWLQLTASAALGFAWAFAGNAAPPLQKQEIKKDDNNTEGQK